MEASRMFSPTFSNNMFKHIIASFLKVKVACHCSQDNPMRARSTTNPVTLVTFLLALVRVLNMTQFAINISLGHYVENTGNVTLKYIEVFKTDKFQDVSLNQWLALTPPELVKAHLGFSDETISKLQKVKPVVAAPFQVQT